MGRILYFPADRTDCVCRWSIHQLNVETYWAKWRKFTIHEFMYIASSSLIKFTHITHSNRRTKTKQNKRNGTTSGKREETDGEGEVKRKSNCFVQIKQAVTAVSSQNESPTPSPIDDGPLQKKQCKLKKFFVNLFLNENRTLCGHRSVKRFYNRFMLHNRPPETCPQSTNE